MVSYIQNYNGPEVLIHFACPVRCMHHVKTYGLDDKLFSVVHKKNICVLSPAHEAYQKNSQ